MALDRRLARELAPFCAATALGFALVPIGTDVNWLRYGAAACLALVIGVACVVLPWRRLPRWSHVIPSLLFLVSIALLRESSETVVAGVGALALVPVIWVALHGTRTQLVALIACVALLFLTTAIVADEQELTMSFWRVAVIFAAASAIVGFAVQTLVGRVRSHAAALAVRERDLEAVTDLSRSLSVVTDARQRICAAACNLSGAHFTVLLEAHDDGTLAWTAGAGMGLSPSTFTPEGEDSLPARAFRSRTSLYVTDPKRHAELERAGSPAAIVFEPVHRGDEVVGVLIAGWPERPKDERRARGLVRLLASEAAFVIERADLLRRLTDIALTDELTGLPNRRAWDERLQQAMRDPRPVCVAILDLDLFKAYNDEHGHQAGDRLLKEAAAAWRAELRPTDTLARYGGEEFVVLLREGDLDAARGVIDRLRAATPGEVSCSAGLALREAGESAAALLGRADSALYDAKRAGRNRSLLADAHV